MRLNLFLLSALAACSADFKGLLTDPDGAPVANAAIALLGRQTAQQFSTTSSADGGFRFSGLPDGEYLLTASHRALLAAEQTVFLPEMPDVSLQLKLRPVATRVNVTAAGMPQSIDEIAKAADTIDSTTLRDRNEHTLLQAVRLTPGIRVTQLGGPGALTRVLARGLRAFDTSLLIDGQRFRDTAAPQGDATGFLGDLLQMNTGRVEVLRGSGSSLYGTHATGGVVNLVTDATASGFHGEAMVEAGGLGAKRALFRTSGSAADQRLLYTFGATHWNVTRGVDGDDRYRNTGLQGWAQWRPTSSGALSARWFGSDNFTGLNGFVSTTGSLPATGDIQAVAFGNFVPAVNDTDSRRAGRFNAVSANYLHSFTPRVLLKGSAQVLRSSRDNRNGPGGSGFQPRFANSNRFDGDNDVLGVRVEAGSLTAGYEFERERFENLGVDETPNAPRAFTAVSQKSSALFAQNQTRLLQQRLQITLSGRWQKFQISLPSFAGGAPRYVGAALAAPPHALTGDAAVSYFMAKSGTKFRSHFGNGYRAPALYERFGTTYFGGNFSPLGDPRLRPERALSFDSGVDQYVASNRVRLSATYFYSGLREVIAYDSISVRPATDPFGRFGGYRNTGGGLARGVETQVEAVVTRSTRFQFAYTHARSQERVSAVIGGSLRTPRIPRHTVTAMVTQQIGKRTVAIFDFVGTSQTMVPLFAGSGSRPFYFDGPRTANVNVNHDIPVSDRVTVRVFSRLENVLDNAWYAEGFRTPGFWGVGGLRLLF